MKNYVSQATHKGGHTLDLIIDSITNPTIECVDVERRNTISDHMFVNFKIVVKENPKSCKVISFRNYGLLDQILFSNHLTTHYYENLVDNCAHNSNDSSTCVNCKTKCYREIASSYIDEKVPVIRKTNKLKEKSGNWYKSEIREAKKVMRRAEKLYHRHDDEHYRNQFQKVKQAKCNKVTAAKCDYHKSKLMTQLNCTVC